MVDGWVYIDESQAPHAAAVDIGQPFWLGALITEHPIEQGFITSALDWLKADPDALENANDAATLSRGYFHASCDSKNAHSWLCRAIVDSKMDAVFSSTQWFFDREDSDQHEGAELHKLTALLSALTAIHDDFDSVNIRIAEREGSLGRHHIERWPDYCEHACLSALVKLPALPTRFPRLDVVLATARDPGVQVCDFVLWAIQRARFDKLTPKGKDDWVRRLGMRMLSTGGVERSAQQAFDAELGRGICHSLPIPPGAPPPRQLETLDDNDRWLLFREMVREIHHAATLAPSSSRIGHLSNRLKEASAACDSADHMPAEALERRSV